LIADEIILETHGLTKEFAGFSPFAMSIFGFAVQHSRLIGPKGRQDHVFQPVDQS